MASLMDVMKLDGVNKIVVDYANSVGFRGVNKFVCGLGGVGSSNCKISETSWENATFWNRRMHEEIAVF